MEILEKIPVPSPQVDCSQCAFYNLVLENVKKASLNASDKEVRMDYYTIFLDRFTYRALNTEVSRYPTCVDHR